MADDVFADPSAFGFETRAIRAGQRHDPSSGAVVTPISLATTFVQESPGQHRGYEYSRTNNPTRQALQECLASLEAAQHGLAFASGMAAEDTLLRAIELNPNSVDALKAYAGFLRLQQRHADALAIIDRALELGYRHPMGPLKLTDLVGLDVRLNIAEHLHRKLGEDQYKPPEILKRMVAEGRTGKKSGHGFYDW